jgi:outer membrane cobalamin receptor
VRLEPLTLNVTHSVTGRRYTREDNSDWLSPYGLSNCNLLFKAPFEGRRLFLKAELNNVLDKDYEVFPYYPMPRRNFRITVGVES